MSEKKKNKCEGFQLEATFDSLIFEAIENVYVVEKTESGLILPAGAHKSQETGNIEMTTPLIQIGRVLTVGKDVTTVKEGDIIYFDIGTVTPIPFATLNYFAMSERSILAKVVPAKV